MCMCMYENIKHATNLTPLHHLAMLKMKVLVSQAHQQVVQFL